MANSTVWWLIAGGAVVLELLSGTIYLLLLAAGLDFFEEDAVGNDDLRRGQVERFDQDAFVAVAEM